MYSLAILTVTNLNESHGKTEVYKSTPNIEVCNVIYRVLFKVKHFRLHIFRDLNSIPGVILTYTKVL